MLVLESILNRTFANMMLTLNKPQFPVYVCASLAEAKACLLEKHPREEQ